MARRYTRDNRGRFSSVGATARGGRLATASGNKRATQTKEISGGKAKGAISKPKGLKPGAIKPKASVPTPKQSSRRRKPTAAESRANGLTPISDIRARQAAEGAARDASRTRRVQSNMTRARGQQVASQGRQRAPFGRYSTIKNPAAEGSFPQMAPGRSGLGMSQAAKGRASTASRRTKTNTQYAQQANRAISKAYAQSASRMAKADGLEQKLRVQQRTQRRLNRIAALAEKRGLVRTVTGIEGFDNPNYRFRGRRR